MTHFIQFLPGRISPRRALALLLVLLLQGALPRIVLADTILLLGDSLSAAYKIPVESSWPALLQDSIDEEHSLKNASVSGETTAGGLARLPALLAKNNTDILIIELGGNDGLRGYPLVRIRKNIEKMIKLGQKKGAKVVLLGMHIPPNYGRRYADGFHNIYLSLAEENNTALLPFLLDGVAKQPRLMQGDGIHPTAEAQPIILQNVLPVLRPLLDSTN